MSLYRKELPESCLRYVLEGLVPYTQANLKLAFMPSLFFNDLEKISRRKQQSLRNSYYRAIKAGLVEVNNNVPQVTNKGLALLEPYKPKKLKGAQLLLIFDIAEADRWKRQHLRILLRELSFVQIQKSVWQSPYDHRKYLAAEIKQLGLEDSVQIYEAVKLTSKRV